MNDAPSIKAWDIWTQSHFKATERHVTKHSKKYLEENYNMKSKEPVLSEEIDKQKANYASAELLQSVCYEDYRRLLDTYDKIYEKINIALAFCGIILLVIVSNFDYTIVSRIIKCSSKLELFPLLLIVVCSLLSTFLIVWSVVQLLLLMRSKLLSVFDSITLRNEELYRQSIEVSSVWLIDKYTRIIALLRPEIDKKQKAFDKAIIKIIVSTLCYAFVLIIEKGL